MLTKNRICNFIELAIDELKILLPIEQHTWAKAKIQRSQNGYEIRFPTKPDFTMIMTVNRSQIPSINSLVQDLKIDSRFQSIENMTSTKWWVLEPGQVVTSMLESYLSQINELKYKEEIAVQIAKNFLLSLDSKNSKITFYCVVRGLIFDVDKYILPHDIQLRKLTDEEINELIDRNPKVAHEDHMPLNSCLLEKQLTLSIHPEPLETTSVNKQPIEIAKEDFTTTITALRLLKDGRVEMQDIYANYDFPGQLIVANLFTPSTLPRKFAEIQSYELSKDRLPTLARIFTAIRSGSIPLRMQTAVDRINFAIERSRADDQLLDLLIAMEAIYGDSSGAIGYKIGIRCAIFIETDFEKRDTICKLINDAYSRRSALVHGGKKGKANLGLTTEQVVNELLTLVRKSINQIIELLLSEGKIPSGEDFDRMLINSTSNKI